MGGFLRRYGEEDGTDAYVREESPARCGECGGECCNGEGQQDTYGCTCEWGSCSRDGLPYKTEEQRDRGCCDECDNRAAARKAVKP